MALYFAASVVFYTGCTVAITAGLYMLVCSGGFLLALSGGAQLSRLIKVKMAGDIFNEMNETFPQEERLLNNEYSFNLPASYHLKGKTRRS